MPALITACRSAQLTPAAYQSYCALLRTFPDAGKPPGRALLRQLAERFAVPLAATLADMVAQDLLQLDVATGGIRAAYPFSAVPTPHHVTRFAPDAAVSPHERAEQQDFAMCALDALGIPLMLVRQATIVSEDALTHEPVQLTITPAGSASPARLDGWRAQWEPSSTVVFARDASHEHEHDGGYAAAGVCCPVTNFFADTAHAQQWAVLHPVSDGVILTQGEALHRAEALFGGVLHRLEEQHT